LEVVAVTCLPRIDESERGRVGGVICLGIVFNAGRDDKPFFNAVMLDK
jgi:hypothetical protein